MNLSITSVQKKGTTQQEHVVLTASGPCNLSTFLVADTTYVDETHVSNIFRHTYLFTDGPMIAGDTVTLFTGQGTDSMRKSGYNTHYVRHWGSAQPIWNNTGDGIQLIEIVDRKGRKVL